MDKPKTSSEVEVTRVGVKEVFKGVAGTLQGFPLRVRIWLGILVPVVFSSIPMMISGDPLTLFVTGAVTIPTVDIGPIVGSRGSLLKLLGLAHLTWVNACAAIVVRLTGDAFGPQLTFSESAVVTTWAIVTLLCLGISVVVDSTDVIVWALGRPGARNVLGKQPADFGLPEGSDVTFDDVFRTVPPYQLLQFHIGLSGVWFGVAFLASLIGGAGLPWWVNVNLAVFGVALFLYSFNKKPSVNLFNISTVVWGFTVLIATLDAFGVGLLVGPTAGVETRWWLGLFASAGFAGVVNNIWAVQTVEKRTSA